MENKLGTSLAGQQQRFYFDKNSGKFRNAVAITNFPTACL